jgi:tRNA-specific 2-thiouridylase
VQRLDPDRNRLLVAKEEELWSSGAVLSEVRWLGAQPALPWQALTQIRGRHRPVTAVLDEDGPGRWRLAFSQPQRAITPGQFAVLYEDDVVRGSGVIVAADPQSGLP